MVTRKNCRTPNTNSPSSIIPNFFQIRQNVGACRKQGDVTYYLHIYCGTARRGLKESYGDVGAQRNSDWISSKRIWRESNYGDFPSNSHESSHLLIKRQKCSNSKGLKMTELDLLEEESRSRRGYSFNTILSFNSKNVCTQWVILNQKGTKSNDILMVCECFLTLVDEFSLYLLLYAPIWKSLKLMKNSSKIYI